MKLDSLGLNLETILRLKAMFELVENPKKKAEFLSELAEKQAAYVQAGQEAAALKNEAELAGQAAKAATESAAQKMAEAENKLLAVEKHLKDAAEASALLQSAKRKAAELSAREAELVEAKALADRRVKAVEEACAAREAAAANAEAAAKDMAAQYEEKLNKLKDLVG